MSNDAQLSVLFQAINALGVVGILGFLVVAFYRGDLVAKTMLDRILAVYEKQLADLTERILERLEIALRASGVKRR
ncbi:MAG: hypothetical protein N2D54_11880 [Chloroflexota bacterium]